MTDRHDTDATLAWMREGTAVLVESVQALSDTALTEPSGLPGWTRAHVIGHVARNAEALARLATWAQTGVETPMYADRAQRAAEIEASSAKPAYLLRAELSQTADLLQQALEALTPERWQTRVRSALGRSIPATEIPWMRDREVWLHAVDLGAGVTPDRLPSSLVDLLIDDAATTLSAREGCPSLTLAPHDRPYTRRLGPNEPDGLVDGSAAEIAGWLTGRFTSPRWPRPPAWL